MGRQWGGAIGGGGGGHMHIPDPKLETQPCDHAPRALGDLIPQQPHVDGTVPILRMEKLRPTEVKCNLPELANLQFQAWLVLAPRWGFSTGTCGFQDCQTGQSQVQSKMQDDALRSPRRLQPGLGEMLLETSLSWHVPI